jgi:hypothetical protein
MKTLKTLFITLFMVTSAVLLSACNVVNVHEHEHGHKNQGYGPPPHAPAHGYRHKHRGYTLEYNYDLGVYVVIGLTDHYYIDGTYYKWTKHGWYSSHDLNKDWHEYKKNAPPGKLSKKHGKGHNKGKDNHSDHEHGKTGKHQDKHHDN